VLTGIEVVEVPGATGWYDTDYEGKRDACLKTLAGGADLFLLHVEATDEAGHAGDLEEKVRALEHWDRRILGPLVEGLDGLGPWRLLLLPDHPTPVARKTHTMDPVPWLLVDSAHPGPGGRFSEAGASGATPVPGHTLMARLIRSGG
jgi:2,3-bisphosphoglycerate-independent phosphoglycerate mutase